MLCGGAGIGGAAGGAVTVIAAARSIEDGGAGSGVVGFAAVAGVTGGLSWIVCFVDWVCAGAAARATCVRLLVLC